MPAGAILVGGQSRRFGKDKALEVFHGRRLIDRGIEALGAFCDPVLVVANDISIYFDIKTTLVQDILPHQGPMGGIHTALLFSPKDWVLVRAVDMPYLNPDLVGLMLGLREGFDAVVPVCDERYEPLSALYHRRCLPAVARMLEGTDRRIVSFYRKVKVRDIPEKEWRVADPEGLSFKNINTPEDWLELYGVE